MSQLRMFLDMEKHPLPDYPVPEGFRITRNGPEVAERYEVLREGASVKKSRRDFPSPAPRRNFPTIRAIAATGAISGRSSALKHIAAGSSALCHA